MSADSKSENRGKMKRGKNSKVSGFRHSSPANNCNDLWNITKPAFKKEYRIGEVLMDAEKEQADSLHHNGAQLRQSRDKLCAIEHGGCAACTVAVFHDSVSQRKIRRKRSRASV